MLAEVLFFLFINFVSSSLYSLGVLVYAVYKSRMNSDWQYLVYWYELQPKVFIGLFFAFSLVKLLSGMYSHFKFCRSL